MKKIFKTLLIIVTIILFLGLVVKLNQEDENEYKKCINEGNGSQYCSRQIGV